MSQTSAIELHAPEVYVGEILDEKYRLDRLLGRGGMGAVYLGTHLGTGRVVAVKLITPEFMRNPECLERFKREARAAGRLRHPNIVDVTDFGVAHIADAGIAYLVMEYLDGCTLSQVLQEQNRLPLNWVVNILEQACAAIHKAHEQGIIHRDLKPANIWLEPNTLGGFRVKVLDFGIAKLAEDQDPAPGPAEIPAKTPEAVTPDSEKTLLDPIVPADRQEPRSTRQTVESSPKTLPISSMREPAGEITTRPTDALTRVGAILGTPLFMSPEQCRGEPLDARSDLYSIGVIAYQMLAGTTPFTGDTESILRAHQQSEPIPLWKKGVKAPRTVSRLVMSVLEKDPAARPQDALAFAHALRAGSETLGALTRRAFMLYSEYFPKVITLSLLAHIPAILASLVLLTFPDHPKLAKLGPLQFPAIGFFRSLGTFVAAAIIAGVVAIMVTQLAATPLKPVSLRSAFRALLQRWRPFLRTGVVATIRIYVGFVFVAFPGIILMTRYLFWAPVSLLENLSGKSALRRSYALARRSQRTTLFATFFQLGVTAVVPWITGRLMSLRATHTDSLKERALSELTSLSSILFLPLVSIVVALAYLKLRQLAGESPVPLETGTVKIGAAEHPTRLLRDESVW